MIWFAKKSFSQLIALVFTLAVVVPVWSQDFVFDFQGDGGAPIANDGFGNLVGTTCNRDGFGPCISNLGQFGYDYRLYQPAVCWSAWACQPALGTAELTPILMEELDINGVKYLHTIIGDPSTGFAQETYIRGSIPINGTSELVSTWAAVHNSGVNSSTVPGTGPLQGPGNGSGNPTKVAIRQVMGGEWDNVAKIWSCGNAAFCDEFLKDTLLNKPKISQSINEAELRTQFVMDMSAINYQDDTTAGLMTLRAEVIDGYFQGGEGIFDISQTPSYAANVNNSVITQAPSISGGRYVYTDSADVDTFGAGGSYTYFTDTFDVSAVDWCSYYDATQNDAVNFLICK